MVSEFRIRPVQPSEVQEAVEVIHQSIANNADGFLFKSNQESADYIHRLMEQRKASRGVFLIAQANDKIVAVGALDDEGMKQANPNGDTPELAKIHVEQNYQGLGLGRSMVLNLIDQATEFGFRGVQLHVTTTQKPAIALYQSLGFQTFYENTYTRGNQTFPTIFMRKQLEG